MVPGGDTVGLSKNVFAEDLVGGGSSSFGLEGGQSPFAFGETVTVDSFLNDDSSNEALVVDYESPKCSPGE